MAMKDTFRKLKRIQFWIICPLVILIGLVSWFMAIGRIQKERDSNKSKIDSLYSTVQNESRKERHANDTVSDEMEKLISKRRDEVAQAWTERWNQQTQTDIFKWPDVLNPRLVQKVKDYRPIETTVGYPVEADKKLPVNLRRNYADYIKDELPKLAERIGAEWRPDGSGGRRGGGGRRMEGPPNVGYRDEGGGRQGVGGGGFEVKAFDQSLVYWNPTNQGEIETQHFDWPAEPGVLEILYAHEDLTVFRSIMSIISKANEGAATRFDAAVKEIEFIRIGMATATDSGQITRATAGAPGLGALSAPGLGMSGREGQGGGREGFMPPPQPPAGAEMYEREGGGRDGGVPGFGMMAMSDPADQRYVDKHYAPLPADTLRSVLKKPVAGEVAEPIDPEFAYLAVAKRIPVRMRLRVDQRKLNRVLTECANSQLTIEIRQVRINPDKAPGASRSSQTSRLGGREMQRREPGGRQGGTRSSSDELFQYDINVELYGIIYVYNPVNKGILGIEEETDEATEEGIEENAEENDSVAMN